MLYPTQDQIRFTGTVYLIILWSTRCMILTTLWSVWLMYPIKWCFRQVSSVSSIVFKDMETFMQVMFFLFFLFFLEYSMFPVVSTAKFLECFLLGKHALFLKYPFKMGCFQDNGGWDVKVLVKLFIRLFPANSSLPSICFFKTSRINHHVEHAQRWLYWY